MSATAGSSQHYKNVVSVLITDMQYKALRKRIRRTGASISGHMRTLLIDDLEQAGLYSYDEDVPEEGSSTIDDEDE
jgi:hypothetical protein